MDRKIVIFGNSDKSTLGFPKPEDFTEYIQNGIFDSNHGRYRYTQKKDADVIVMSRAGLAYGHFEIASTEEPTNADRQEYPPVKRVYLVSKSKLYPNPVRLSSLSIKGIQFGKPLTERKFKEIQDISGHIRDSTDVAIPEEIPNGKYPEGAVKRIQVNAYERNAAAVKKCKAHYGTQCQVCDLDLGKFYGEIGVGYIHVHHLKQLSDVGEEYEVDAVADLRPVCPNCHAMLHRSNPPMTIDELKQRINRQGVRQAEK